MVHHPGGEGGNGLLHACQRPHDDTHALQVARAATEDGHAHPGGHHAEDAAGVGRLLHDAREEARGMAHREQARAEAAVGRLVADDEGLGGEVAHAHRGAAREAVGLRQQGDEVLLFDQQVDDGRAVELADAEGDVEPALEQGGVLQGRGQVLQVDVHARVPVAEGLQHARQAAVDGEVHVAHAQPALPPLRCLLRGVDRAAQMAQRHPALHGEGVTRRGQPHAPGRALEQGHPHGLLELPDRAAQRRLRHEQARRRPPEVQFLGDEDEGSGLAQVELQRLERGLGWGCHWCKL